MKGKIYASEKVNNKDHKFGESNEYYIAKYVDANGVELNIAFTKNELDKAINRAAKNSEDFEEESFESDWFESFD